MSKPSRVLIIIAVIVIAIIAWFMATYGYSYWKYKYGNRNPNEIRCGNGYPECPENMVCLGSCLDCREEYGTCAHVNPKMYKSLMHKNQ